VRKVASGRQNGDFEIAFDLAEATKFFDRRGRSLFAPYEQRRLTEAAQGVSHVDVEMARQECGRRVTSSPLMGSRVMDLDQLTRDQRVVRVCVIEIAAKLWPGNEGVEHGGAGDRCIDRETARFTAQAYGLVETDQPRWRDESYGWEAVWITRTVGSSITLLTKSEMSEM
jgi:hypothetical protein